MRRRKPGLRALSTIVVAAFLLALIPAAALRAAPGDACQITYAIQSQWQDGFVTNLTIRNTGANPFNGWTLTWTFPGNQRITNLWNANWSQTGQAVTTSNNADWNRVIPSGGQYTFGFQATYSATNATPTNFAVNGVACGGQATTTTTGQTTTTTGQTTTSRATTTTGPTTTGATTTTSGQTTTTTGGGGGHVENPYSGTRLYVNPDWAAQVQAQASADGSAAEARVAQFSTAVWLDRIAAVTGGSGVTRTLEGHLDEAVRQMGSGGPLSITIVVYDLPNRDCAALASNGELLITQNGLNIYKTQYIDQIAAIIGSKPAYRNLRIVAVVEPDSIPNLVTNLSTPACAEANSTNAYRDGVRYALTKLSAFTNVYKYLDIAHSGWLGWPSNFGPAVDRFVQLLDAGQGGPGLGSVDGFISNTANYTPTTEPFIPSNSGTIGGQQIMSATFYEFNPYNSELAYAQDLRSQFVARGMPQGTAMLIDTSRNGWGGPNRPTQASTSTDLNTWVNASKIDRRPHRGGWCNQNGAGIGARPTTSSPATGIDAFVWIKPPGESDGVSSNVPDPNDPNKKFDAMCDPNAQNRYNNAFPTNALPNAPHAGRWFPEQFQMLVRNAFPAV
jgi:cellulose 1,4-beta-cellobiosidase